MRVIKKLFIKLKEYWYIHDLDYGTIHSEIFETLYIKSGESKSSHEEIAHRFYIGNRTLGRYISKYNTVAKKLIQCEYSNLYCFLTKKFIIT